MRIKIYRSLNVKIRRLFGWVSNAVGGLVCESQAKAEPATFVGAMARKQDCRVPHPSLS
jgi:hypothetical protein